jgi:hypothetical protein
MRKLTILRILILAMSVLAVNTFASTPEGVCPVWTHGELNRIGTLGGNDLLDYEYNDGGCEYYYDLEIGALFTHHAVIFKSGNYLLGRYYSTSSITGVKNIYRSIVLNGYQYNACKQQLINHVTQH